MEQNLTFSDLGLSPQILQALEQKVQEQKVWNQALSQERTAPGQI